MNRLTGGRARGRVLRTAVPRSARPTTARVREALFSLLGQDLRGERFLDAFGGAGLVGLEAWSRGAEVTVVERDRRAVRAIRAAGEELGADWTVMSADVLRLADRLQPFDVVFADPPYAAAPGPVLAALAPLATRLLVLEARRGGVVLAPAGFELNRQRPYGESTLWLFRPVPR